MSDNEIELNLNDVVSQIFQTRVCDEYTKIKKRRQRLTTEQICMLELEFQKKANWSGKDLTRLSKQLQV